MQTTEYMNVVKNRFLNEKNSMTALIYNASCKVNEENVISKIDGLSLLTHMTKQRSNQRKGEGEGIGRGMGKFEINISDPDPSWRP